MLPLRTLSTLLVIACLPLWVSAQAPANAPAPAGGKPPVAPAAAAERKFALLLPPQSGPLARAVGALLDGVSAAQSAAGERVEVLTIEVDEQPQSLGRALRSAREQGAEVVIGPLLRPQVNAALRADPGVPLITLSPPDGNVEPSDDVLVFGLGIETEARWLARAAIAAAAPGDASPGGVPRFAIVVGDGPLARRAAGAMQAALQEAGERVTVVNLAAGYEALQQLADRLFRLGPKAILLALDAPEAAMIRPRLAHDAVLYATSQVNVGGDEGALLMPDLEGIRFVDAPWLVAPDHPAVMAYPRPSQPLSSELNRLYALGIDAFRLALEWASGWRVFSVDGVTGELRVDRIRGARVDRTPAFAVFREGKVQRWDTATGGAGR